LLAGRGFRGSGDAGPQHLVVTRFQEYQDGNPLSRKSTPTPGSTGNPRIRQGPSNVPSVSGRGLGGSSPESKPLPRDIRILLRPEGPAHPNLTRVGGLVVPGCGSDCTFRVLGIADSGTSKTNQPEWVVPGS